LPYSASRVLAARVEGRFRAVAIRSEPKQQPPYRPLADVMKAQRRRQGDTPGHSTTSSTRVIPETACYPTSCLALS
jgi:Alpha-acetolactate decarboxylase